MKDQINVYRLLEPFEGHAIETYTGKINRIIGVEQDSVLVGTQKSPSGEPVPIDDIREALERLLAEGKVMYQGAAPRSNRDSFVVAFLIALLGVVKHPERAGALLEDRIELERFTYAVGV